MSVRFMTAMIAVVLMGRPMLGGIVRSFTGPANKAVKLWIPARLRARDIVDVVVHFHGAAWLPEQAVAALGSNTVVAVLNLGTGSGAYDRAFADPAAFGTLLASVTREAVGSARETAARCARDTGGILRRARCGARHSLRAAPFRHRRRGVAA